MRHFVSVAELVELLGSPHPPRVLDARWSLAEPHGRPAYLAGHLPGAVWIDVENELAGHGEPHEGRHPLPSLDALQESVRRWGLDDGDLVIVYDDAKGLPAARAWWMLRRAGVGVRVLDGGLRAWRAAGLPVETGDVEPTRGSATLHEPAGDAIDIDEAAAFPGVGVLIDARAPERYRGDVEPLDPIAGHIPGAVNVPAAALVDADGLLADPETLRAAFAEAGVADGVPVAASCGSGISAAHTALVLAELGIDASVFVGSWSAWSNTPGRPIAVGETPSGDVTPRP